MTLKLAQALSACCLLIATACVDRMAVDTTAGILSEAEGSTRAYFDWESAGYAAPSGIMQLEGLHTISPDNEQLALTLAKAYMAYAYGWVMDEYEEAYAKGDFDLADHHQQRAYLMYTRARDLVLGALTRRDPHFPEQLHKDPQSLTTYLKQNFRDREDDIPILFWLMMTWSSSVNNSPNMDALVDMPLIRAIAARIVAQDPGYEDAGALVFLGGFECSMPEQVGGNPRRGKQYFEQALSLTHRHNHIMLYNYAVYCAVALQDRALYMALLREILEAPDQGNDYRLSNKVARRRAQRALTRADELFY
jgi:hypothetical protein